MIISAFPGTGKTTLHKKYPAMLDSDSSTFDKSDFPNNYIKHIKEKQAGHDIILVSSHKQVREALVNNHLWFLLVYPHIDLKEEYLNRYRNREGFNGGDKFADLIDKNWDQWIKECQEQKGCSHRILTSNEFLENIF